MPAARPAPSPPRRRIALLAGLALAATLTALLLVPHASASAFPGPDASPQKYRGQDTIGTGTGPALVAPNFPAYATIAATGGAIRVPGTCTNCGVSPSPLTKDEYSASCRPLGFTFVYYGANYDCVWINSNGFLIPDASTALTTPTGSGNQPKPVPNGVPPRPVISPFWVDTYGNYCLKSLATAGIWEKAFPDRFVVEFRDVLLQDDAFAGGASCANQTPAPDATPTYITWQVILYSSTMPDIRANAIDVLLPDAKTTDGCTPRDPNGNPPPAPSVWCEASIGIAGPGAAPNGIEYSYGTTAYAGRGIRFWPNHPPSYASPQLTIMEDDPSTFNVILTPTPDMDGDAVACTVPSGPASDVGTMGGPFAPISGSCTHTFQTAVDYCNSFTSSLQIPFTAVDALGASPAAASGYTDIIVTCVNDAPLRAGGASVPSAPVGQPVDVLNWVTDIQPGPDTATDESGQLVSFVLQPGIPAGAFSSGPSLSPTGLLSYTGATAGTYQACFLEVDDGPGTPPDLNTNPAALCVMLTIDPLGPNGTPCSGLAPDFFVSATDIYYGQTITFNDRSQGTVDHAEWSFGDGYVSDSIGATHAYGATGDYTVRLTVYDPAGCSAFVDKLLHVMQPPPQGDQPIPAPDDPGSGYGAQPPTVQAGDDQEVREGALVNLGATVSGAAADDVRFTWRQTGGPSVLLRHADGATPDFDAPHLANPEQPAYLIFAVHVSDVTGDSPEDFVQVTVVAQNHRPVANAGPDVTVSKGGSVQLTAGGSRDADNDGLTYGWSVVAGSPAVEGLPSDQASVRVKTPADTTAQFIDIRLVVSDGTSTSADTVRIWLQAPSANAVSGFRATAYRDGSVRFDANAKATKYVWDFGDGSGVVTTTDPSVTHRYLASGTYTVQLSLGGGSEPMEQVVAATVPQGAATPAANNSSPVMEGVVALVSAVGAALLVGGLLSWSLRQRKAK